MIRVQKDVPRYRPRPINITHPAPVSTEWIEKFVDNAVQLRITDIWNRIRACADSDTPHRLIVLDRRDCRKLLASTRPADPAHAGQGPC